MDSLYDLRVYDYAYRYLYGQVDPEPGELFVGEWRLKVEENIGDHYDAVVTVASDNARQLSFGLFPDHVESIWEEDVTLSVTPGVFHEYRVETSNMHTYELYIDGSLAHEGTFWQGSLESKLSWGDAVSGAANLSHWDYVHFGVVPEPSAIWLFVAGLAACVLRAMRSSMRRAVLLPVLACILTASAAAEPYWVTYEGNALPEEEGWQRNWGNDDGAHEGDGAVRTVEDGILTMDSLYDLRVYDYACRYLYGEVDPDPGELLIAECRVDVDEAIGDGYDSTFGVSSDGGMQLAFGLFPDRIESIWEDNVVFQVTPGAFHDYRVLSWDMQTYALYIDGALAYQGNFLQRPLQSKLAWGDGVSGAASLTHWDYVHFGVVPEPSAIWLFVAGLAACVVRTVRGGMRRVVFLPVLACILTASATAGPYWIAYEGNDLPENEGWGRSWGNDDGQYHGHGAVRTVENGILTMDSLYDLRVYDYAYRYLYGEFDPDPGELFVAEWRLKVDETIGDGYDAKVGISSDEGWQLGIACFPDHIISKFEDNVEIPVEPGVFHECRVLSWDMQTYDLYIDGGLAHQGTFWHRYLESKFGWGDCVRGAASLSHWDYVRFGVVPEPCSVLMLITLCACARRSRARLVEET